MGYIAGDRKGRSYGVQIAGRRGRRPLRSAVREEMVYNPSVTALPCHLPLHKGGFSPYNNFTNYAVSICKQVNIILQDLLLIIFMV